MNTNTLPTLTTSKYELTLPSSGETIEFRPFLVKEEKILLTAQESNDQRQIMRAVADVIKACTFDKVDANKLPLYDIEKIFIELRTKSVGSKSNVSLSCSSCEAPNELEFDLDDVEMVKVDERPDKKIMINDTVGVVVRDVKMKELANIDSGSYTDAISSAIEQIFDADSVWVADELTKRELNEFVDNFAHSTVQLITDYLQSAPKFVLKSKFTCKKCAHPNESEVTGITNFFS